jgi:diguanylate cyclase (GGDEF)-like protein/PAS domain S-box-containing protein
MRVHSQVIKLMNELNHYKRLNDLFKISHFEINILNDEIKINMNHKFAKEFGITRHVLTLNFADFLLYIPISYKEFILDFKKTMLKAKINDEFKIEHPIIIHPSKKVFWVIAVIKRRNENEYYGIHLDITELKETQLQLQATKDEYELLINNVSDLIAKFNLKGEIIFASQSYCRLFDLQMKDIIGKNIFILNEKLSMFNHNWYKKVLVPPYESTELIHIKTDIKDERWISWQNKGIFEDGELVSIISVGHDVTEITKMNQQLIYEANHDVVTGLYNRRGIYNQLRDLEPQDSLISFIIDVTNLNEINEFYGYEIGDIITQKLALKLSKFKDLGCLIGRLDNQKFVLLFPGVKDHTTINLINNRLNLSLNKPLKIKRTRVYVSTTIGYAVYPTDTDNLEKVMVYSELATHESKGKFYKWVHFQPSMLERLNLNVNLSNDLKECLSSGCLQLVFQSIINTKDQSIQYIETLARWNHKTKGNISPGIFIPIAEKSGLQEELDLYVLQKSFMQFGKIKQLEDYTLSKLTVNITPPTLLNHNFTNQLKKLITRYTLNPADICIEINENTFMNNMNDCITQIKRIKSLGVLVALDDFGSKYSSLSILDEVDVDIIKVDGSFVRKINKPTIQTILKMIRDVSVLDRKEVIIEGVETEEQVKILNEIGFHLIQGYFYSKPEPILISDIQSKEAVSK